MLHDTQNKTFDPVLFFFINSSGIFGVSIYIKEGLGLTILLSRFDTHAVF